MRLVDSAGDQCRAHAYKHRDISIRVSDFTFLRRNMFYDRVLAGLDGLYYMDAIKIFCIYSRRELTLSAATITHYNLEPPISPAKLKL